MHRQAVSLKKISRANNKPKKIYHNTWYSQFTQLLGRTITCCHCDKTVKGLCSNLRIYQPYWPRKTNSGSAMAWFLLNSRGTLLQLLKSKPLAWNNGGTKPENRVNPCLTQYRCRHKKTHDKSDRELPGTKDRSNVNMQWKRHGKYDGNRH